MYARTVRFRVRENFRQAAASIYQSQVLDQLQTFPNCRLASLLVNRNQAGELLSLTLWNERKAIDDYTAGPVFQSIMEQLAPALAETGRKRAAPGEPRIRAYAVALQQALKPECGKQPLAMNARWLTLLLNPGQAAEFKHVYIQQIIPALEKIRGCCRAFLLENLDKPAEMVSLTFWERPRDIHRYESAGDFALLLGKIQHTLVHLSPEREGSAKNRSAAGHPGEYLSISLYTTVCGFDRDAEGGVATWRS